MKCQDGEFLTLLCNHCHHSGTCREDECGDETGCNIHPGFEPDDDEGCPIFARCVMLCECAISDNDGQYIIFQSYCNLQQHNTF